jgi:hypothetical protein
MAEDTSTEYVIGNSIPVMKSREMPTLMEQNRGPADGAAIEGTDQELIVNSSSEQHQVNQDNSRSHISTRYQHHSAKTSFILFSLHHLYLISLNPRFPKCRRLSSPTSSTSSASKDDQTVGMRGRR